MDTSSPLDTGLVAEKAGLSARRVAFDLLNAVLEKCKPFDESLQQHPGFDKLSLADRALARNLAATTLRRLGQIDALLQGWLTQPLSEASPSARTLLRLGAVQLLFLRTPAYAAVNTTVTLAESRRSQAPRNLINAVLRRTAQEGAGLIAAQDELELNTPSWLWLSWSKIYGEATCRDIARAHLLNPPLHLTPRFQANDLAKRLDAYCLPTGSLCLASGGRVDALPGFSEGEWWVQDAAAALPVRLLGNVHGQRVIDLCAAPGGKTAQLAARGAEVIAIDISTPRLQRVHDNLTRLRLNAELVEADACVWRPAQAADAVLIDAPCTATGTIRRHPDIPWLKAADDVVALGRQQRKLLESAIAMVKPGGTIVYCVCSLEPQEGPAIVDAAMASGAPVRPLPLSPTEMSGISEFITADGALRTLPCQWREHGGLDGFYAVRFLRT
ncbi:MAG: methyltransferase domain-containing protein [Hyphomicrobiales bacterium]|nr:methyltransferase domain-containing protein [Hyphomicrobiales bacterium]